MAAASGHANQADSASARKVVSIPFDLDLNLIFVPVSIDGSRPLSFILDTGSYTMIGTSQAESLGLDLQLVGTTDGIGDDQQNVYLVTGEAPYGPPGAVLAHQRLLSVPLGQVEECFNNASLGEPDSGTTHVQGSNPRKRRAVDGILGTEFFNSFVVAIDYKSRVIDVYDPTSYRYEGEGERFGLAYQASRNLQTTEGNTSINREVPIAYAPYRYSAFTRPHVVASTPTPSSRDGVPSSWYT